MEQQTPQTPQMGDPQDVEKNKVMAMLAYLIFFLPLLTDAKDSPFAKYHANQGLLLLIASVVASIVGWILTLIFFVLAFIGWIFSIATLVLFIIGIMNANNGKMVPLPIIGGLATIIK